MTYAKRILAVAALSVGCGGDTEKETDSACIEGAAQDSVQVVVTDLEGNALPDAVVTWDNGGGAQPCEPIGNQHLCGRDDVGEITVSASADGFVSASKTVTVESDGCHAITVGEVFRLEAE